MPRVVACLAWERTWCDEGQRIDSLSSEPSARRVSRQGEETWGLTPWRGRRTRLLGMIEAILQRVREEVRESGADPRVSYELRDRPASDIRFHKAELLLVSSPLSLLAYLCSHVLPS